MDILSIAQIAVSVLLVVLILLQERSAGGGIFSGGGDAGGFYQTRRGLEKFIFIATFVLMIAFAVLALLNLVV